MSEIIYLYISRAKDDIVAENLLIYVYPPYTFTEIKYIYLTPILHTYTSRPYVCYVGTPYIRPPHNPYVYTPTAIHIGMLRTTLLQPSIALDRNEATRAKPIKGEEVVGKKKFAAEPPEYSNHYI